MSIKGAVRQFPKFALAFGIIFGSIALLVAWMVTRSVKKAVSNDSVAVAGITPKAVQIDPQATQLILVDNDLYDLRSGKLLIPSLFKEGMPLALAYDADAKRFIAQYPNGFIRYDYTGNIKEQFYERFKPAYADDLKWLLYSKDKDIWKADIDWKEFKTVNDRKITSIEQFNDPNFADSIILRTEKTLLVRNMNALLQVNLETGNVKPIRLSLDKISKRRSPDSKSVVGVDGGQFWYSDVDSDDTQTIPVGRGAFNDFQWLGNDRCACIFAMKKVLLYDRLNKSLTELVALPSQCNQIVEPSADGRYIFCSGGGKGVLVDVEKKTAIPIVAGPGVKWVSSDTFAFSREVPDSDLRGSWLQTVGEGERRVSNEPYLVSLSGAQLVPIPAFDLVLLATKHGLSTMKADGTSVTEVIKLSHAPGRVSVLSAWNH